ncbi:MAG: shikimate kinase [Planctomycetota bacterium]
MMTVALMGLRGSGKSTIGPAVAAELGLPFRDLDPLTLDASGSSTAAEVVDAGGWTAFRAFELEALSAVLSQGPCVLGLGGGTPTDDGCRRLIEASQQAGSLRLVYLRASPAVLGERIGPGDDRPSLTGIDPKDEIEAVFAERDPLYRSMADAVVECDGLSIDEQAAAVIAELGR